MQANATPSAGGRPRSTNAAQSRPYRKKVHQRPTCGRCARANSSASGPPSRPRASRRAAWTRCPFRGRARAAGRARRGSCRCAGGPLWSSASASRVWVSRRPVSRRETRRIDARKSHCRFLVRYQSVQTTTVSGVSDCRGFSVEEVGGAYRLR